MLLTHTIAQSNIPYSGNYEFIDIIDFLSNLKSSKNYPVKLQIILNAIKLWSVACRDGNITCNRESLIEGLNEYFIRLDYVINTEINDDATKTKCWNNSGNSLFKQTINNLS
ncbi:hypothetical protein CMI47_12735 [Candidatus Pacearchaeota archaeon]|nr:hypothetical protein [Candidatus Pacearchaeota archaeon]